MAPPEAVDPVCGMTVPVHAGAISLEVDGVVYHFCCDGCRARFESDPAAFASASS
jgi:YHS domain-containing protein